MLKVRLSRLWKVVTNSLFVYRCSINCSQYRQKNMECFLSPQEAPEKAGSERNILLPHQQEITIGRGQQYGIKDLACSKKQLMLEADTLTRSVKVRRIGRNPSILAGFPLEEDHIYIARDGMKLQISPDVEYIIRFQEKTNSDKLQIESQSCLPEKFIWSVNTTGTVLCCQTNDFKFGTLCKIASFDLDGTLIRTKSGYTFPTNEDDWILWHIDVSKHLKTLVNEGYSLIMFTNQAQLEVLSQTRVNLFKKKIENIVNALDVPFYVLIATNRDIYRKPAPGMWELCVSNIHGVLDKNSSFYVGDAAGRLSISKPKKSADFEITDRLFARNIEIKFYTPEEFFLKELPREFKDVSFHPDELPTEDYPELNLPSQPSELIVMVGCPASGKSYFVQSQLECKGYTRVSRDELKAWTKCRDKLINALSKRQNVVYDATNPDKESRKQVLDVCLKLKFTNIRCFVMTTSEDRCIHNNRFRQLVKNSDPVPHTVIVTFYKRYEEPSTNEGFTSIVKVPFVPKFHTSHLEQLYRKYLLGKKK